jgi:hypothetical protein
VLATERGWVGSTIRMYTGPAARCGRHRALLSRVDLNRPSVDSMFVDVPSRAVRTPLLPNSCRASPRNSLATSTPSTRQTARSSPCGTGSAAPGLGNALLVGGPGQGKSTLLQYICQFPPCSITGQARVRGLGAATEPAHDCGTRRDSPRSAQVRRVGKSHPTRQPGRQEPTAEGETEGKKEKPTILRRAAPPLAAVMATSLWHPSTGAPAGAAPVQPG